LQLVALSNADAAFVELCSRTFHRAENLVAHGVIDDAKDRLLLVKQGDGNAEMRDSMQEIAGAVQRVDDPGVARLARLS